MFCPLCGREIPDDSVFCPECGGRICQKYMMDTSSYQEEQAEQNEFRRQNKNGLLIAAIGLIAIAAIAGVFAYNHMKSKTTETESLVRKEVDKEYEGVEQTPGEVLESNRNDGIKKEIDTEQPVAITAADLQLSVMDSQPADLAIYHQVPISSTYATSTIVQEGYDNSSHQVIDGRDETSWQEGVDGDGTGQSVTLNLADSAKVKYIGLKLGNWRSAEHYAENNVPSSMLIEMGDYLELANFSYDQVTHWVVLSDEWDTSEITLIIEGVYYGSDWQDTCIAEVMVYGK